MDMVCDVRPYLKLHWKFNDQRGSSYSQLYTFLLAYDMNEKLGVKFLRK